MPRPKPATAKRFSTPRKKSELSLPVVQKGKRRGRKPAAVAAGGKDMDKTHCLNCATLVSFENTGRKLSEPLHKRSSRKKVEKILEDRASSDPSSVRKVLDVIFDLTERASAAGRRLDVRTSRLCWKCTMILRQLHKLFGEFVEAAVFPSLMTAVYAQNGLLSEFQAELREPKISESDSADDGTIDDKTAVGIKAEPEVLSDVDECPISPDQDMEIQRETRIPRSCKKSMNYKKLSMGKIEPESDPDEDTEYILPDQKIKRKSPKRSIEPEEIVAEKPHRKYRKRTKLPDTADPDYEPDTKPADTDPIDENETAPDEERPEKKRAKRSSKKKSENEDGKENSIKIPCPVCKRNSCSEEALQAHLEEKHVPYTKVRSHRCPDCIKSFWSKHDLNNHIKTHTKEACFVCEHCGYKTKRPQELSRHQKLVHLNEKNFHCEVCNKGYALRWQLMDHARVHRDERTFPCTAPGCDKAFRTPSNLRQHLELHKGSKYVCHICGLSYSRKAYLRLHVNAAHFGKPFPAAKKKDFDPLARPIRPRLPRTKPVGKDSPSQQISPRKRKASMALPKNTVVHYSELEDRPGVKNLVRILPNITENHNHGIQQIQHINVNVKEEDERILVLTEYNPEEHDMELISDEQIEEEEIEETEVLEVIEEEGEDGAIKLVEVHMQLDESLVEAAVESEEQEHELEQHHYTISDDQQIICYPVSSMGVVQNIPMAISSTLNVANNTYYITTQGTDEAGDGQGTSISVYNPFQEFMGMQ